MPAPASDRGGVHGDGPDHPGAAREHVALLRTAPLLTDLDDATLAQLATNAVIVGVAPGEVVVREGAAADHVWLVVAGVLEVGALRGDDTVRLATVSAGGIVGEAALYTRDATRTATVTATAPARLLRLDAAAVRAAARADPDLDTALAGLADRSLAHTLLRTASPMRALDADTLRVLVEDVERVEVAAGEVVAAEGATGDEAWLVLDGTLAVLAGGPDGRVLADGLGRGHVVGELALLGDEPRNATIVARTAATLFVLHREALHRLLQAPPAHRLLGELALVHGRPVPRDDVEVHTRTTPDGRTEHLLRDGRPRYFQLSDRGLFVWRQIDGSATVRDLTMAYIREFRSFAPQVVGALVHRLRVAGFVTMASVPPPPVPGPLALAMRARALVSGEVRLADGEAFARRVHRLVRPLLHPVVGVVAAGVALAGLVALLTGRAGPRGDVDAAALGLAYAWVLLGTLLHELAHAVATVHAGRRVAGMGVGWMLLFPVAWVDTTDMWLGTRRQRLVVDLAGIGVDATLGGAAALAAAATDGFVATVLGVVALQLWLQVALNCNPLLELDGYAALRDGLQRPHLRKDGLVWVVRALRRAVGRGDGQPLGGGLTAAFGVGAVAYMVLAAVFMVTVLPGVLGDLLTGVLGDTAGPVATGVGVVAAVAVVLALVGELAVVGRSVPRAVR